MRQMISTLLLGVSMHGSLAWSQEGEPSPAVPPGNGTSAERAPASLSAEETAKQLANPNTALASLTLKSQWTHWEGSLLDSGGEDSQTLLFQPSFPFPVTDTDRIFLRPAFPYLVDQPVVDGAGNVRAETGMADMGLDLAYGRTWTSGFLAVAGIVAGIPIGADALTTDTWTLGPELFVGHMSKQGVIGIFANHQWDISGPRDTSLTSIQPFLTYLAGGGWAIGSTGTMTYNWKAEQWTIPLQAQVSRTIKLGSLPVRVAFEVNYYVEKADALGQEWMVGLNLTPVVPNVVANWLSGH